MDVRRSDQVIFLNLIYFYNAKQGVSDPLKCFAGHSPIRSVDFEAFHALSLITDQALTPFFPKVCAALFALNENQPIKADFETLLCRIITNVNYLPLTYPMHHNRGPTLS